MSAAATASVPAPAESKTALGLVRKTTAFHLDPKNIRRKPGFNPRFEFGEIELLARSIAQNGVLNAIRVKKAAPGVFELVDGDRRFTAIELLLANAKAGKLPAHTFPEGVPSIIVDKDQDEITDLVQMFEANTGKPFAPLEKAAAFKRMRDAGLSVTQIMQRTSCTDHDVIGSLALLDGDESLVKAVADGKVSGGTAKAIAVAARGNKTKQAELAAAVVAAGKDKGKLKAAKKAIDSTRRAKAAAKGKALKIRALDDEELSAMGLNVGECLKVLLEQQGMSFDSDLREWAANDPELAIAFTFGALEALKAAAGAKVSLELP